MQNKFTTCTSFESEEGGELHVSGWFFTLKGYWDEDPIDGIKLLKSASRTYQALVSENNKQRGSGGLNTSKGGPPDANNEKSE